MGRRKIEIRKIKDERHRAITFRKRSGGLRKKAHELAVLCDVEIELRLISENARKYRFPGTDDTHLAKIYRFVRSLPPKDLWRNADDTDGKQHGNVVEHEGTENILESMDVDDTDANGQSEESPLPGQYSPTDRLMIPRNPPIQSNSQLECHAKSLIAVPNHFSTEGLFKPVAQDDVRYSNSNHNAPQHQYPYAPVPPRSHVYAQNPPLYIPPAGGGFSMQRQYGLHHRYPPAFPYMQPGAQPPGPAQPQIQQPPSYRPWMRPVSPGRHQQPRQAMPMPPYPSPPPQPPQEQFIPEKSPMVKIEPPSLEGEIHNPLTPLGDQTGPEDQLRSMAAQALEMYAEEPATRMAEQYMHDVSDMGPNAMTVAPKETLINYEQELFAPDRAECPKEWQTETHKDESLEKPQKYCICGQEEFGKMVECDNKTCLIGWHHFRCIGLKRKYAPKVWLCPRCRQNK